MYVFGLRPPGVSQALIAGVDPSNESLLIGDFEQQRGQRVALFFTESREESILVLPCNFAQLFEDFPASFCQMKGIQTPVIRIGSPLYESPLLEIVEDRDHAAGMNPQLGCELLLADSGCHAQQAQDPCIGGSKFENP